MIYISIDEHNRPHFLRSLNTCTLKSIHIQDHSIQQFLYLFSNSSSFNKFISVHFQDHFYIHSTTFYIQRCEIYSGSCHIHSATSAQQQLRITSHDTVAPRAQGNLRKLQKIKMANGQTESVSTFLFNWEQLFSAASNLLGEYERLWGSTSVHQRETVQIRLEDVLLHLHSSGFTWTKIAEMDLTHKHPTQVMMGSQQWLLMTLTLRLPKMLVDSFHVTSIH